MGSCQNYGPFLGTLNIRCRIIKRIQKGTILLTNTQTLRIYIYIYTLLCHSSFHFLFHHPNINPYIYTLQAYRTPLKSWKNGWGQRAPGERISSSGAGSSSYENRGLGFRVYRVCGYRAAGRCEVHAHVCHKGSSTCRSS